MDTAADRLRTWAASHPQRPALDDGDTVLTYAELDARVDAVAAALLDDLGTGGDRVAVRVATTDALMAASLGVARAGKVVVPIDPAAPVARADAILTEVQPALLLGDQDDLDDAAMCMSVVPVATYTTANPRPVDVATDPAAPSAILFTSGSTGVPKGIVVPGAWRQKIASWAGAQFEPGLRVGMLAVGSLGAADAALHAVVHAGGTVVPYDIRALGLAPMADWLRDHHVEGFYTVPTVLRLFLPTLGPDERFPELGLVLLTGEPVTWDDVAQLRAHLADSAEVRNLYAVTEAGLISVMTVTPDMPLGTGFLPAGRPVGDDRVFIVDPDGAPVAPGEAGEIVVEAESVGLGYWARPDLTRAVYTELADGRRRCHTGDAGTLSADGVLEPLGRLDHVVKVSGNRIDLGDVEAALRSIPGVTAAAVAPHTDADGSVRLAAFVVAGPDVTLPALRTGLARRVPGYMLPDRIERLDVLPTLSNGKVDRSALPAPSTARPDLSAAPVAPSHHLEQVLAEIWAEVMEYDEVGVHDDFFELGGDSMRAARIFTEVERRLDLVRPASLLLEAPTVATLAAVLAEDTGRRIVVPVRVEGTLPPLFAVHGGGGGVWFARGLAAHLDEDQPVYGLQPPIDPGTQLTERTMEELCARYLAEVRALRPRGPYLFFGYSLGAVMAFEMALQLQRAGEEVPVLAIGDARAPGGYAPSRPAAVRARARVQEVRTQSGARVLQRAGGIIVRGARFRARKRIALMRETAQERDARLVMQAYAPLAFDYAPRERFGGRVLLIRTAALEPADGGWGAHTAGVDVVPIPGGHGDIIDEPQLGYVGSAVRDAIRVTLAQV
jgi:acyl-coenzyme A synthetase/AMP-(fatty) acid ligase/thioesterase domain-containing protein/acyl carrier protein